MRVINIEGIDAVGKETVSKALENELKEKGYRVKRVSFPNYDGSIGKSIKEILMGACGDAPSIDPELMGPFYTMDRLSYFERNIEDLIENYDYVIMDRSFYSNLMYQASKYYVSYKTSGESKIENLTVDTEISSFGMPLSVIYKLMKWIEKNYQWEIIETGLYRCDNMLTFVLQMSEEDSKNQLSNRTEKDTNETNRTYLSLCKEFISKLINDDCRCNIKKVFSLGWIDTPNSCNIYNTAFYYLDNVEAVEVTHADRQEDIPFVTAVTVGKIMYWLENYDMFDDKGDDTNGEN